MSLINEALKRASQAQQRHKTGEPDLAFRPADAAAPPASGWDKAFVIQLSVAFLLVAVVLGTGGWLGGRWWRQRQASTPTTPQVPARTVAVPSAPDVPPARPAPAPVAPPPVAAEVAPTPAAVPPPASVVAAAPVSAPAPSLAPVTAPAPDAAPVAIPPASEPVLKLQGIFYRATNPSALINGKTVGVGDTVSGARVRKIERSAVALEVNGQERRLELVSE